MCVILYEYLASTVSDLLRLEFQWLWIPGTKPIPSAVAGSALNCWTISKICITARAFILPLFVCFLDVQIVAIIIYRCTACEHSEIIPFDLQAKFVFHWNNAICVPWLISSYCLQTLLFQYASCPDQIAYQTVVHSFLWLSALFLGPSSNSLIRVSNSWHCENT